MNAGNAKADKVGDERQDECISPTGSVAMTPQQRRFTSQTSLDTYRQLVVGERGWFYLLGFELYSLLLSGLPSLVGLVARRAVLPFFLAAARGKAVIGRGVSIRGPQRIRFGRHVLVDDYVSIDARVEPGDPDESGVYFGNNVVVGRQSIVVAKRGQIHLGDGCNVGSQCRIATQSKIEIGESVLIAAYVYVGPGNHQIEAASGEDAEKPLIEREMEIKGGVRIGAHSWIGTRATILDGVTIGREAIIGAHSLVTSDVPDRAIVAGTPARLIRFRE